MRIKQSQHSALVQSQQIQSQQGFTLVELVVGIVLGALALTFISTLFYSSSTRSVEPILQIRAAAFGQALLEEIMAKPFDDNTPVGGVPACSTLGVDPATDCTAQNALGNEEGNDRTLFDDVDDYNSYCGSSTPVTTIFDNTPAGFDRYEMTVCVVYDGNYNGVNDADESVSSVDAKLITVDIFPPTSAGLANGIRFTAYRSNF